MKLSDEALAAIRKEVEHPSRSFVSNSELMKRIVNALEKLP